MRAVIDLDHHGLRMSDRRPVDVALWVAVKTAGGQRDAGRGVFIFASGSVPYTLPGTKPLGSDATYLAISPGTVTHTC